jgi:hypothetical protein
MARLVRYAIVLATDADLGSHAQSLILGTPVLVAALLSFALGVLSELMRTNRILLEDMLERAQIAQYEGVGSLTGRIFV